MQAVDTTSALRFITCGSVDDGKSTLIGRLLVDSRSVLLDQLASVQRAGSTDLALLTDGLMAEREQGITIDVAYRYFATARRKFVIGDTPGHEQYTRNMVTSASSADAAVVLIDATKLDWRSPSLALLAQTRRHTLLVHLLRVPSIVFAINKLDAVADPSLAFAHISQAIEAFAQSAGIVPRALLPISALLGHNVVDAHSGWCGYHGPSLLALLESLPKTQADNDESFALPVQWVEKNAGSADTSKARRTLWGRIAAGSLQPGQTIAVSASGQRAQVVAVLNHARQPADLRAGQSAGIVLDRELDVSRGDWLYVADSEDEAASGNRTIRATLAWLDIEPLVLGRVYWALHGHAWVRAKVERIAHQIDIHTLAQLPVQQLEVNAIGDVELSLQTPLRTRAYARSRVQGAMVLVDPASHQTAGAVLIH